jgi:hypothetical protein
MAKIVCKLGCTCGRHNKSISHTTDYFNMHRKIKYYRGRAAQYICIKCQKQAKHWAKVHGVSGFDPWDYVPMCISCHHAYDKIHERAGFHGHAHSEESKAKISEASRETHRRKGHNVT